MGVPPVLWIFRHKLLGVPRLMQTSIGLPPVHVAFLPGSENLQPESWAETAEGPGADVLHRTNRRLSQ